jgi:Zn-dependent protease with chaperone function
LTVIDSAEPAAFCIPGRQPTIVVTTAACTALTPRQMEAVLGHEQTHLRERHHYLRSAAVVLLTAFPLIPLFRELPSQTRRFSEMAADDGAARRSGSIATAAALFGLSGRAGPTSVLQAGGHSTAERIARLLGASQPLSSIQRSVLVGITAAAILVPFALVGTPGVAAASGSSGTSSSYHHPPACPFHLF